MPGHPGGPYLDERNRGQEQRHSAPSAATQQRQQKGSQDEDEAGRQ